MRVVKYFLIWLAAAILLSYITSCSIYKIDAPTSYLCGPQKKGPESVDPGPASSPP